MGIIEAKNIYHTYNRINEDGELVPDHEAVQNVSLEIKPGEFVAILGHNGSGKSTLAKHFNALLFPTAGVVYVDRMNTQDEAELLKIRQTAGMVFQNPDNQIIAGVVEEDVGFGPENMGVPTMEIWQRVEDSLAAVGMTMYREHSPNKLSGGQKQRVAIAGVVAMRPKCIILDEPTAMLDPKGRREVVKTVRRLHDEEGITVLLITHNMEEAVHADRVVVMDHGRIVMNGTPREVFVRVEELKKLRLDVPQMTLLAYELRKAGIPLREDVMTREELVEALSEVFSSKEPG